MTLRADPCQLQRSKLKVNTNMNGLNRGKSGSRGMLIGRLAKKRKSSAPLQSMHQGSYRTVSNKTYTKQCKQRQTGSDRQLTTVSCSGIVPRAPSAAPRANLTGGTPVKPQTRHSGPLKPTENLCIAPARHCMGSTCIAVQHMSISAPTRHVHAMQIAHSTAPRIA